MAANDKRKARLPNFLGLGPRRSASTWLFECLREHPDVFVPTGKETYFFSDQHEKGAAFYASFFENECGERAVGDMTPDYLGCSECPARIYGLLPEVRMITILRNPVDRAFSDYRALIRSRQRWSFEESLKQDPSLLEEGLYAKHLEKYFEYFDRDRFLILFFEDVIRDNAATIKEVYSFIGVDPSFVPKHLGKATNVAPVPAFASLMKKPILRHVYSAVGCSPFGGALRKWILRSKTNSPPVMAPDVREFLESYYKVANADLASLIGYVPPGW